jgi:4-hydroxybenzoate polyprenyltransferase/phosphoserine phosphatase
VWVKDENSQFVTGAAATGSGKSVLCVDLDGTLLPTDVLWESVLLLLRYAPWLALCLPFWLLRGKAYMKRRIADRVTLDVSTLPYRDEVIQFLAQEMTAGRHIVLATASDGTIAQRIAAHLGLFSEVMASDGTVNLRGCVKAARLAGRFGHGMFDYMGDSRVDLPVWKASRRAFVVAPARGLLKRVERVALVERTLASPQGWLRPAIRVMRPHQWIKNLLVFVPLIAAHQVTELPLLGQVVAAFVAFCLCASAVYVLNDLLDIQNDRRHPRKRYRPFAAAALPVPIGFVMVALLLTLSFAVAWMTQPPLFLAMLCGYLALTTAYSFVLKTAPVLDVVVLASLYALRLLAGGVAVSIVLSEWLLLFALFLFLSLALVKRFTELKAMAQDDRPLAGRGYLAEDASLLQAAGICSGYIAVLVLALYINSRDVTVLYTNPRMLWALCVILIFWITRMWFRAHRGSMEDDPIVGAVRDPASYAVAALGAMVLIRAI